MAHKFLPSTSQNGENRAKISIGDQAAIKRMERKVTQ